MTSPRTPAPRLGDWTRIVLIGVCLAGLVWFAFFFESKPGVPNVPQPIAGPARVATPEIDHALLQTVRDSTRQERLILEPEPLAHLLEISLAVVPSVARELGMPDRPIPISMLRASPSSYRGAYLWYRGVLKYVSPGKGGHPVDGYKIHEGWIETAEGEKVLFRVSRSPRDLEVGEWVRVEGFFLKLRDSHHLPTADQAPLLIGPELFRDYAPWPPVTELDPEVLGSATDGSFEDGRYVPGGEAELDLRESEGEALWHLASFAMHRETTGADSDAVWRRRPAFVTKDQLDAYRRGDVPRGTPIRVLGTFVQSRSFPARPNPVGIETWTEAWVQIRDLGGKIVPVWVPREVRGLQYNQPLDVHAYFFRRLAYETQEGALIFTPVFVAADLDRFRLAPEHPMATWAKASFAAFVAFVVGLLFWMARRDRRTRAEHEEALIERRRRRRSRAAGQET